MYTYVPYTFSKRPKKIIIEIMNSVAFHPMLHFDFGILSFFVLTANPPFGPPWKLRSSRTTQGGKCLVGAILLEEKDRAPTWTDTRKYIAMAHDREDEYEVNFLLFFCTAGALVVVTV